jgi:hypothetical protein
LRIFGKHIKQCEKVNGIWTFPTPLPICVLLKTSGLANQDDVTKLDWIFEENIIRLIIYK